MSSAYSITRPKMSLIKLESEHNTFHHRSSATEVEVKSLKPFNQPNETKRNCKWTKQLVSFRNLGLRNPSSGTEVNVLFSFPGFSKPRREWEREVPSCDMTVCRVMKSPQGRSGQGAVVDYGRPWETEMASCCWILNHYWHMLRVQGCLIHIWGMEYNNWDSSGE